MCKDFTCFFSCGALSRWRSQTWAQLDRCTEPECERRGHETCKFWAGFSELQQEWASLGASHCTGFVYSFTCLCEPNTQYARVFELIFSLYVCCSSTYVYMHSKPG